MSSVRSDRPGDAARVMVYREVVLPLVDSSTNSIGFNVGAYTSVGDPLSDFRLRRSGRIETIEPPFPAHSKRVEGHSTYGGVIDFHFGHFMIETLSRLWYLARVSYGPIIWHRQVPHDLEPWQREIFGLCGLDVARFFFVSEAVLADEIAIAEPAVVIDEYYTSFWSTSLDVFPFHSPLPGKKIWMSRSKMPADYGHVVQEVEIEQRLSSLGWTVVHPNLMTNVNFLHLISDAETISGFAASAYFVLLLAKNCRAKVRMVDRGGMGIPRVFEHYAMAKKVDQEIMRPKLEHVSGVGAKATFQLESIDAIIEFVNG